MPAYTFSGMEVNVPEGSSINSVAEQREARDQRTRAAMSKKVYKDAILARISEAMDDTRTPLGDLVDRLFDAPIRDSFDYRAYLQLHNGHNIGAELLCAVADCSLAEYQDADQEGF
jgi:hypothetical protein